MNKQGSTITSGVKLITCNEREEKKIIRSVLKVDDCMDFIHQELVSKFKSECFVFLVYFNLGHGEVVWFAKELCIGCSS